MKKQLRNVTFFAILWACLAILLVGGATYAWFTFSPMTNVEPMSGTISDGDTTLLISTDRGGTFSTECLLPKLEVAYSPVSTVDLNRFYEAVMQNKNGIAVSFRDTTDSIEQKALHGTLYLQSYKDNCYVYFNRAGMDFGNDPQLLAALRLGLKITTGSGEQTYIFALNSMGDTRNAVSKVTVPENGKILANIGSDKSGVYVHDIARELSEFTAGTGNGNLPTAGANALCTIQANEIATVEYWMYLEGCDEHCSNVVQDKDVPFQLSFAGVTVQ